MIVVVIIGLLAVMGMPAFQKARQRTQNTRIANDLRKFADSFETYSMEHGEWPADTNPGELPPEMDGYIAQVKFETRTVYGGNYDWEGPGAFVFTAAISIRDSNLQAPQAEGIDEILDDGNLGTGTFRDIGGAYAIILEE